MKYKFGILFVLCFALFFTFDIHKTSAVTCTSITSGAGNWNATGSWTGCTGGNGTPANTPGSADTAVISTTAKITVTSSVTVSALTFNTLCTQCVLQVDSGQTLTVTNAITVQSLESATGRVVYIQNGSGPGQVSAGSLTLGSAITPSGTRTTTLNLTISTTTISGNVSTVCSDGASASRRNDPTLAIVSGTTTVSGTITLCNSSSATTAGRATLTMATSTQTGALVLSNSSPWSMGAGGNAATTLNGTNSTVEYSAAAPTLRVTPYTNLVLSGSGTASGAVSSITGNLSMKGSVSWTNSALTSLGSFASMNTASFTSGTGLSVSGSIGVGSGSTFTTGCGVLLASSTVNVSGTLNTSGCATGKAFTGVVTVNSGGVFDMSATNATTTYYGGITHNGTTFNNGTGATYFGADQSLAGSSNMTFGGSVTSGTGFTVTNNNTGTVSVSSITLNGGWTQGASSYLKMTSTSPFSGSGSATLGSNTNTVEYSASSTLRAATYSNLLLSATSTTPASGSNITIRGNLTINSGIPVTKGASDGGIIIFAKGGEQSYIDNNSTPTDIGRAQISANTTNTTLHLASNAKFTSLTVDSSQTFKPYGSTVYITSSSTGISNSGTFTTGSSTVEYTGDGATVSCGNTYYNLNLKPTSSGTQTICTAGGSSLTVFNNLNIGNGGTSGASAATYDPNIYVGGVLTISANNTYTTGAGTTTLAGAGTPLVVNGSLNATTDCGSIHYTGTTATNITPASYCTLAFGTSTNNIYTLGTSAGQSFTVVNNLLYAGNFTNYATITASRWNPNITIKGGFLASTNYSPYIAGIGTLKFQSNGATIPIYDLASIPSNLGDVRISLGSANTTVTPKNNIKLNTLFLENSQTFDLTQPEANGAILTLSVTGTSTPIVVGGGNFTLSTSTINYIGTSTSNIVIASTTYNYLGLGTEVDSIATTYASGSTTVTGLLNIGNSSNSSNKDILSLSDNLTLSGSSTPLNITDGGTFTTNTSATIYTGSSTVTCANATYYDLQLKPSGSNPQTICYASGKTLNVTRNLTIGDGTNAGANAGLYNPAIIVGQNFTVAANAVATSTSGTFKLSGDFTNNGTFVPNNGTVIFAPTGTSTITGSGTNFYNVTSTTSGKGLLFGSSNTLNINGTFTVQGTAGNLINIDSSDGATQWLAHFASAQGSGNVTYVNLKNSGCSSSAAVSLDSTSQNGSNNDSNCWAFGTSIIVSGTVYIDEAGTAATVGNGGACNGGSELSISIGGAAPTSVSCDGTNANFSSTLNVNSNGGQILAIFLNGQTDKAIAYTKTTSTPSNIPNIPLRKNRVTLWGDLSNANIGTFDQLDDSDIPIMYQGGVLTASSSKKLIVETGYTYTPGSTTTVDSVEIKGTYTGGTEDLILTGSGISTTCTDTPGTVQPLCINSGTFTAPSNVKFLGTEETRVSPGTTLTNLEIGTTGNNTDVTYTLGVNPTVTGIITIGGSSGTGVHNFNLASSTLTLSNTGTPLRINSMGSTTASTSLIKYTGNGAKVTCTNITYFQLELKPSGSTPQDLCTGSGQALNIGSTTGSYLIVGDTTNVGATGLTYSPAITNSGITIINSNATMTPPSNLVNLNNGLVVNGGLVSTATTSITVRYTASQAGLGIISLTDGSLEYRSSGINTSVRTSSNSNPWTFNDLLLSTTRAGTTAINFTCTSNCQYNVGKNLIVGRTTDSFATSWGQGNFATWVFSGTGTPIQLVNASVANTPLSNLNFTGVGSTTLEFRGTVGTVKVIPTDTSTYYFGATNASSSIYNLQLGDGVHALTFDTSINKPGIALKQSLNIQPSVTYVKGSPIQFSTSSTAYLYDYTSGQDLGDVEIGAGATNPILQLYGNPKINTITFSSANSSINIGTSTLSLYGTGTPIRYISPAGQYSANIGSSAGTVNYTGTSSAVTIATSTYKNLGVGTDSDTTVNTYQLNGSTTVTNTLTVGNSNSTGSDFFSTANNYLSVGHVNVTSKGNFSPFGSTVDIIGDGITNNGTFTYGTSTINVTPSFATTTGTSTVLVQGSSDTGFYKFNATSTTSRSLKFGAGKTYSFYNAVSIIGDIYGGNISLDSNDGSNLWNLFIDQSASYTLGYLSVKNSACASNTKTISQSNTILDNGYNGSCWSFSSHGGGGSSGNNGSVSGEGSGSGSQQSGGSQGGSGQNGTPPGEGSGSGGQQNGGGAGGGGGDVGLLPKKSWIAWLPESFTSPGTIFSFVFKQNP